MRSSSAARSTTCLQTCWMTSSRGRLPLHLTAEAATGERARATTTTRMGPTIDKGPVLFGTVTNVRVLVESVGLVERQMSCPIRFSDDGLAINTAVSPGLLLCLRLSHPFHRYPGDYRLIAQGHPMVKIHAACTSPRSLLFCVWCAPQCCCSGTSRTGSTTLEAVCLICRYLGPVSKRYLVSSMAEISSRFNAFQRVVGRRQMAGRLV